MRNLHAFNLIFFLYLKLKLTKYYKRVKQESSTQFIPLRANDERSSSESTSTFKIFLGLTMPNIQSKLSCRCPIKTCYQDQDRNCHLASPKCPSISIFFIFLSLLISSSHICQGNSLHLQNSKYLGLCVFQTSHFWILCKLGSGWEVWAWIWSDLNHFLLNHEGIWKEPSVSRSYLYGLLIECWLDLCSHCQFLILELSPKTYTNESFWLNCSRCPCTMPNME